uniref:Uncharacterized protein n=1 Tax=Magallana gigas TaxID=29159 RepID=K1R497_MAGGI
MDKSMQDKFLIRDVLSDLIASPIMWCPWLQSSSSQGEGSRGHRWKRSRLKVVMMRKSPPSPLLIRVFCDVHSRKLAIIEGVVSKGPPYTGQSVLCATISY